MKRKSWAIIVLAAVLSVAAFCVARTPRFDALERQGDRLVQQIEQYRATHGTYPLSFEQAGIGRPLTFFGYWYYVPVRPNSFELWVGDYGRDRFKLHYLPGHGWHADT